MKITKIDFEKVDPSQIPVAFVIEADDGKERVIMYMKIPIENIDITNSGFVSFKTDTKKTT